MSDSAPLKPVLSVRDLNVDFNVDGQRQQVLYDVGFDIAPGETLAIVGESGSGKSVTAMSIMRLIGKEVGAQISGNITLDGRELLGLDELDMQSVRGNRIAMIFQEPMTSLNPIMTVGDQLSETLFAHRNVGKTEARTEAIALLDTVRIPSAAQRFKDYPYQMSGGMRQRVMIAMALACKPTVLIADEPTTALDVTIQAQILNLIKTLQDEEGMGVLFITHDMGVVAEIAHRTAVMHQGRMVETGTTSQIFNHPEEPYTRMLLSSVPTLGSMKGSTSPRRFPEIDPATGIAHADDLRPDTRAPSLDVEPVLEVRNLVTRFDVRSGLFNRVSERVHAVENVSFSLHPGETLALVGESGCGKSTTGRSVLRLVEPVSGEVIANGKDLLALNRSALRKERRQMQMIYQDPFASLDPRMTVGAAIAEPLLVHEIGTAASRLDRVAELLARVGLPEDCVSRFPHEFSGGQRQRICIARSLALEPSFIIADESVSALDVSVKAQIVNLLFDLQQSMGLAYLFISHDMAIVERISHRVAVMYLGEIVEIGPRADVLGNPQHPYTKRLISAVPIPDPARRSMRRDLAIDEIPSPVRAVDHVPPKRQYRTISPGHLVQEHGPEWFAAPTANSMD